MYTTIQATGGAILAAGDLGTVIMMNNSAAAPLRLTLAARPRIFAAALYNPRLAYLAGERGEIWRWVGRSWEALAPFTMADLCALAVAAPGDILAGTADGALWRLDGNARPVCFADLRPARAERRPVAAVRALMAQGPGDIWAAVGAVVFRMSGPRQAERWTLTDGADVAALCAPPASAGVAPAYAVGRGGAWRLYRGGTGEAQRIAGPAECFTAAACGADGTLYAVAQAADGSGPAELRAWSGGRWRVLMRTPGPGELRGVAVADDGAVWIAGAASGQPALYRHDPSTQIDTSGLKIPVHTGRQTARMRPCPGKQTARGGAAGH